MVPRKVKGSDSDGIRKLLERELGSDSEVSDIFSDERSIHESISDSEATSAEEESGESDNELIVPPPAKKQSLITPSDWKWVKSENNPVVYQFSGDSGVCNEIKNQ
ncbi:hypothetical protein L9F63_012431 [Diploptera punctata]|uniref:Uncharacterized protein n=1 Tax=Diploptera punctata TaxID=6984 RepID=A0AAD8ENX9_DIPPU|nr:hypothetical protein L9F63_012431 [Diploptera punctata]